MIPAITLALTLLLPLAAGNAAEPVTGIGDPIPLSRREPLLGPLDIEADLHYGLVGSGPTQLTNDLRLGLTAWWELWTSFAPYPAGLMTRFKLGQQQSAMGALVFDGGLALFDVGVRIIPTAGEPPLGLRGHFELGVAYARALSEVLALHSSLRWRHRVSALSDDEQSALAGTAQLTWDVMPNFSVTAGIGYGRVVAGEVRELAIHFVEPGRPGLTTFLVRQDGFVDSVTVPLSLTYGFVDTFDVDVFATPRVYPHLDVLLGAGIRLRVLDVGRVLARVVHGEAASVVKAPLE